MFTALAFDAYDHGMPEVPVSLPGHELVNAGLRDLAAGRESEASLLVAMAARRLRAVGVQVPEGGGENCPHIVCMSSSPSVTPAAHIAATTRSWAAS